MTHRREFLAGVGALGGALLLNQSARGGDPASGVCAAGAAFDAPAEYTLPPLPYPEDALEPHIDKETMAIHHGKHHAGYVKGLNTTLKALADARDAGKYENTQQLTRLLAFHAGGHFNHVVFWNNMAPAGKGGGGEPQGKLADQIEKDFGDLAKFRAHFSAAAIQVEGNGWGVLAYHPALQRLVIFNLMNQQDLTPAGTVPLLMLDVWEHAYYLKYQNRRADYLEAWWNTVDWDAVAANFAAAKK